MIMEIKMNNSLTFDEVADKLDVQWRNFKNWL